MTNLFLHIIAVINRGIFHMVPDRDYSASNVSKGQLMDENVSQMYHA